MSASTSTMIRMPRSCRQLRITWNYASRISILGVLYFLGGGGGGVGCFLFVCCLFTPWGEVVLFWGKLVGEVHWFGGGGGGEKLPLCRPLGLIPVMGAWNYSGAPLIRNAGSVDPQYRGVLIGCNPITWSAMSPSLLICQVY